MANITKAVQDIVAAGVTPTYTTPTITDTYLVNNNGKTLIHVKNANAAPTVVTIVTPNTVGGNAIADLTVTVPATTGDVMIGHLPPAIYNNSGGNLEITFSVATSVTFATLRA